MFFAECSSKNCCPGPRPTHQDESHRVDVDTAERRQDVVDTDANKSHQLFDHEETSELLLLSVKSV